MQDAGCPIQLKYAFILPVAYYDESSRLPLLPIACCRLPIHHESSRYFFAYCPLPIGYWSVILSQDSMPIIIHH